MNGRGFEKEPQSRTAEFLENETLGHLLRPEHSHPHLAPWT
jgi:hypothetical protein